MASATDGEAQSPEQIREEIESLLGTTVGNLRTALEGGAQRTKRVKCPSCSQYVSIEIDAMDVDLQVKALNALSAAAPRLKGKDEGSVKAAKLISDFSELSSQEIAEEIARLEAIIDADQEG